METKMSDTEDTKKRPTHIIWAVTGEGDDAFWTRIGAGWTNRDGKGISLRLDCIPLRGRTVIREVTEEEPAGEPHGDAAPTTGGKRKGGQK
jgi:hypothetical protein